MNEHTLTTERANALIADGWREYPDQFKSYARCLYKKFPTLTACRLNRGDGLQVCIALSRDGYDGFPTSIEVDISGELHGAGEKRIRFMIHGMRDDLKEAYDAIPILLSAWEAANQSAPNEF